MAYDQVEPIGPGPERYLLAMGVSVQLNTWRSKGQPITPEQVWAEALAGFRVERPPTPLERMQQQKAMFAAIAAGQRARTGRQARIAARQTAARKEAVRPTPSGVSRTGPARDARHARG